MGINEEGPGTVTLKPGPFLLKKSVLMRCFIEVFCSYALMIQRKS